MILALALLFHVWADLPPAPITAAKSQWRWADNHAEPWRRRGRRG